MVYLLTKSAHIVAFVAWFAGLFYLPRLFVYHAEQPQAAKVLAIMEKRLLSIIMRPALVATWGSGVALLAQQPYLMGMGWVHAKLTLVLVLSAYHGSLEKMRMDFVRGTHTRSGRFYRAWNEVPTVLLIVIVLLAVLKPF